MARVVWVLECLSANGRIMFVTGGTRDDVYFTARGASAAAAQMRREDLAHGIVTDVRATRYEPAAKGARK